MRKDRFRDEESATASYPDPRGTFMDLFYWAMLGGLVGTVMMDITGRIAGKLKIPWGG